MKKTILLLAACSGAAALLYELLWLRELSLVFGTTTAAVATVTGVFLLGLGLGSSLLGRWSERAKNPLAAYALLETGIAATALVSLLLFRSPLFLWLHSVAYAQGAAAVAGGRILLATLLLLPPAFLMGGAMPLLAKQAMDRRGRFPLLYLANTLGGALGLLLGGFLLIRVAGVTATFLIAVAINLSAAGIAFAKRSEHRTTTSEDEPGDRSGLPLLFMSGLLCLGLEVLWARILTLYTFATSYVFATLLLGFLLGLATGSLTTLVEKRPRRLFGIAAAATGVATMAILLLFSNLPFTLPGIPRLYTELLIVFIASFLPAAAMGALFPTGVMLVAETRRAGASVGDAYVWNAVGSVVGSLGTGFLLIPFLGLRNTGLLFAGIAILLAARVWIGPLWTRRWTLQEWAGLLVCFLLLCSVAMVAASTSKVYGPDRHRGEVRFYEEGISATVTVVEQDGERILTVDNEGVASTQLQAKADAKLLAHLPLLLAREPKKAASVGYGTGGTSASMLLHGVEVTTVEIEPAVVRASGLFTEMNHNAESDPALTIRIDDARSYFLSTDEEFDVIVTDVTNLKYKGNPSIYSKEYFEAMKARLSEQGVAAAWLPLYGLDFEDVRTLVATFDNVYPHTTVWGYTQEDIGFLIAIATPEELNPLRFSNITDPVRKDLEEIRIMDEEDLRADLILDEEAVDALVREASLHTDDHPVLEYSHLDAYYGPEEEDNGVLLRRYG